MSNTGHPRRAFLERFAGVVLDVVARGATDEQWAEWLRVPLEHAAAAGDMELFDELIEAGADGSAGWRGCGGRTLLDAAVQGGNPNVVSALLAAGAQEDVNVVSASGRSALYLATSLGHEDAAIRLVEAGADVHFRDPGDDCDVLLAAARGGREQLVNDLLTAGASPNTRGGEFEETPLHVAAESGFEGMATALLAKGADKDALDRYGHSPLLLAIERSRVSARCFALGAASYMSTEESHAAVVDSLLAAGANVEFRDLEDRTALLVAAEGRHVEALLPVLRHGADANAAGFGGYAALHIVVDGCCDLGPVDALIEAGADIELRNWDGLTPLGYATGCSSHEAMSALLERGANINVRDNEENTLLHVACRERFGGGLDRAVDLLLQSGADETAVNDDGKTPLEVFDLVPPEESAAYPPEELQRVRLLLTRAPADRAWRRRWPLVMLRSRASKAGKASCDELGGSEHSTDAAGGEEDRGRSKMARVEHAGGGASGVLGQTADGRADGADNEGERSRAVMESLFRLDIEGIFRTVVGFL